MFPKCADDSRRFQNFLFRVEETRDTLTGKSFREEREKAKVGGGGGGGKGGGGGVGEWGRGWQGGQDGV